MTAKERAEKAIHSIKDPASRRDVLDYIQILKDQATRARDDASRLRFPDTTGQ